MLTMPFDSSLAFGNWFLGWVRKKLTNERCYRRSLAELRTMSERELTDLGISVHDLPDIARAEAARGC